LCELIALPACGPGLAQGYRNVPTSHPQYVGAYAANAAYPRGQGDLIVQIGARDMGGPTLPTTPRLPNGMKFVAVGMDTATLGRTQPLSLAVVGDVKASVRDLIDSLKSMATAERLAKIRAARMPLVKGAVADARTRLMNAVKTNYGRAPIHPDELAYEMEQVLDRDAVLVTESQTAPGSQNDPGTTLFTTGYRENEKMWVTNTGLSLGWGLGAAIGVKLGEPNRQVVCSIGD